MNCCFGCDCALVVLTDAKRYFVAWFDTIKICGIHERTFMKEQLFYPTIDVQEAIIFDLRFNASNNSSLVPFVKQIRDFLLFNVRG